MSPVLKCKSPAAKYIPATTKINPVMYTIYHQNPVTLFTISIQLHYLQLVSSYTIYN